MTLANPAWTDPADVDDFTVVSSSVVKKVSSSSTASMAIDVKVGTSSFSTGATQTTSTSYVRYSRTDLTNPISTAEWTSADLNDLKIATRCVDCSPNTRATQMQSKVDAIYNSEFAFEVRFAWTSVSQLGLSTYLVVECRRLVQQGAENVLVQVGQGGASPTSWRTAATCASDTDQWFDPSPLSPTELNGGSPVVRLWDQQVDTPDDTLQGVATLDVLRIDVHVVSTLAEGTADAVVRSTGVLNATVTTGDFSPIATDYPDRFVYITRDGNYSFNKANRHLLELSDQAGLRQIIASSFYVDSTPASIVANSQTTTWTNTSYVSRYDVMIGSVVQGNVTTTYAFSSSASVKITVNFQKLANSTITGHRIVWRSQTNNTYVETQQGVVANFASFSQLTAISAPLLVADVGEAMDSERWLQRLHYDWNDVGSGQLYVGPVALPGTPSLPGIVIEFPLGLSLLDPSTVARSTDYLATAYQTQRKSFEAFGRYWVFLSVGSDIGYASSRDGLIWSGISTIGTGVVTGSFDVYQAGSVVSLAWLSYAPYGTESSITALLFLRGVLHESGEIMWDGLPMQPIQPVIVYAIDVSFKWDLVPVSVAMGTDGSYWAGAVFPTAACPPSPCPWIRLFRWDGVDPLGFAEVGAWQTVTVGDTREALVIAPLSGGKVRVVSSHYASTSVRWRDYTSTGWVPAGGPSALNIDLPPYSNKVSLLSAVSDSSDVVHIAYRKSSSLRLGYATLTSPTTGFFETLDATTTVVFPTISLDLDNDVHIYWKLTTSNYEIWHERKTDTGWVASEKMLTEDRALYHLSAPRHSIRTGFLAWTGYYYTIGRTVDVYRVQFGQLPLSATVGEGVAEPWSRAGISPHETYHQQLQHFVSPGNGQLTIPETDLVIPGRGLDVSVSRVYRPPALFVADGSGGDRPYLYYEDEYGAFGPGWRLNLPSIRAPFVYLWDGQAYFIRWGMNRVFENRQGTRFTLVDVSTINDPNSYDLYTADGVRYRLAPNIPTTGKITVDYIIDLTENLINVVYDGSGQIDYIRDTLGNPSRDIDFAWVSGRVSTVSQAGRFFQYDYTDGRLWRIWSPDPDRPATEFSYGASSACSDLLTNPFLLRAVSLPVGGRVEYCYRKAYVGTEAYTYVVSRQNVFDRERVLLKSTSMGWTFLDGRVTFANFTYQDGQQVQGNELFLFGDGVLGSSTRIARDAAWRELRRTVTFFGAGGVPMREVAYEGGSTSESASTTSLYDDWGNVVYARDAIGRETFATYANTQTAGFLRRPGFVDRTTNGLVLYYDFEDRQLRQWQKTGTGKLEFDYGTFHRVAPSLLVEGTTATASGQHILPAPLASATFSFVVSLREKTKDHYITLWSGAAPVVELLFLNGGGIAYLNTVGSYQALPGVTYEALKWYRVAFVVRSSDFDIYLDGAIPQGGQELDRFEGNIDKMEFRCVWGSALRVAEAVVHGMGETPGTGAVRLSNLARGQWASLVDPWSGLSVSDAVDLRGEDEAVMYMPPNASPKALLTVYDWDGSKLFERPGLYFRGDQYRFWPARDFQPMVKLKSGYMAHGQGVAPPDPVIWVDEPPLPGNAHSDQDGWNWVTPPAPPGRTRSHRSPPVLLGWHQHSFDGASTELAVNPNSTIVQYVYLPGGSVPARIELQLGDGGTWYTAKWGAPELRFEQMTGPLPSKANRWSLLVAKASDIGIASSTNFDAARYRVKGGVAFWDVTSIDYEQDWSGTSVRVRDLRPGQRVQLLTALGIVLDDQTVTATDSKVDLDIYDLGWRTAFPLPAFFRVYDVDGATLEYVSPLFGEVWPGDEYVYTRAFFPPSASVDSRNHRALLGSMSWTNRSLDEVLSLDMETPSLAKSPVGFYRLVDGSGLGNDPELAFGTTDVVGLSGRARGFRGEGYVDYLRVWASRNLNPRREMSAAFWLWVDAFPSDTSKKVYPLTNGDVWLGSDAWRFNLRYDQTWKLDFSLRSVGSTGSCSGPSTVYTVTSTTAITTGTWIHVTGTYDGSTQQLHVKHANGQSVTPLPHPNAFCDIPQDVFIGYSHVLGETLNGRIDEVLVSSRALTAAEALGLYQSRRPVAIRSHGVLDADGAGVRSYTRGSGSVLQVFSPIDAYGNVVESIGPTGDRYALQYGSAFASAYLTSMTATRPDSTVDASLAPTSNGARNDWTAVGCAEASEWECVNQADEDATYIWTSTLGSRSLFGLGDLAPGSNAIAFVELRVTAKATAAPSVSQTSPRLVLRIGGERSQPYLLGTSYGQLAFRLYANPATGRSWTEADVNALEAGTELGVSNTGSVRATQVELFVRRLPGPTISGTYDYEYNTGTLLWERDAVQNPMDPQQRTDYHYDLVGRVDQVTLPPDRYNVRHLISYGFDDPGSAVTVTNERGFQTKLYYDGAGRPIRVERLSSGGSVYSTEQFLYDWRDQLVSYTTGGGHVYAKQYDFFGRETRITRPDGTFVRVAYDDLANTATYETVEADGSTIRSKVIHTYDEAGQLVQTREYRDAIMSHTADMGYDHMGTVVYVKDAKGTTYRTHNEWGNPIRVDYPDGRFEISGYDSASKITQFVDRAGNQALYGYDSLGRLTSLQDSVGTITYAYDNNGNLKSATDGTKVVSYEHDLRQRTWKERSQFDGATYEFLFDHDPAGNVAKITYPDLAEVSYTYDEFNRLTSAAGYASGFAYDRDDQLVRFDLANGLREWRLYDVMGRMTNQKVYKEGSSTTSIHDLRPMSDAAVQWSDYPSAGLNFEKVDEILWDGDATYVYESMIGEKDLFALPDLPSGITFVDYVDLTVVARATQYQIEADSSLSLVLRVNGVDYASPPKALQVTYTTATHRWFTNPETGAAWTKTAVDALMAGVQVGYLDQGSIRATQVYVSVQTRTTTPTEARLEMAWTRDAESNVRTMYKCSAWTDGYCATFASETHGYDWLGRLTSSSLSTGAWGPLSWIYDEVGNRETQTEGSVGTQYTPGPYNRLESYHVGSSQPVSFTYDLNGNIQTRYQSGGDSWAYAFNTRNELTQVVRNAQTLGSFTYDPVGRRVKSVEGGATIHFAFAGAQVLFEKDLGTGLTTRYVMANGLRIARVSASGTQYYHQDYTGNVRVMTDAGRVATFQTDYKPFGELFNPNPPGGQSYTFIGEFRDNAIGLHYFGARYYDAGIGRFVSLDPVIGAPGMPQTLNRYVYALNNPIKYADPSGLYPEGTNRNGMCPPFDVDCRFGDDPVGGPILDWWDSKSPEEKGWIAAAVTAVVVVAACATIIACPAALAYAGAVIGVSGATVLTVAATASAVGAYAVVTWASGGTPTLEGAANAALIGLTGSSFAAYGLRGTLGPSFFYSQSTPTPPRHSPGWFQAQGYSRVQIPDEGLFVRRVQAGGRPLGYNWGAASPGSLAEARGMYGPLTQRGTPNQLIVGWVRPGSPSVWGRLHPISGITEYNIPPSSIVVWMKFPLLRR